MNKNASLKNRMLGYENVTNTRLTRRTPVILRLDMRSGHSFTKGFDKPFDDVFITSMQQTMAYLCSNIQGCVLGYHQSDEITLVLIDYQSIDTDAWFDYRVQKLCSVTSSMATMAFNKYFYENVNAFESCNYELGLMDDRKKELGNIYWDAVEKGAMFDARCFNIPKEEVVNALIYRQQDCTRNSIQMLGQSEFSSKALHGKNQSQIQDMLMLELGINWNDLDTYKKRGSCCIKETFYADNIERTIWKIDTNIPIFTQDRYYIERFIYIEKKAE